MDKLTNGAVPVGIHQFTEDAEVRIAVCMKAVIEPEARIELHESGQLRRSQLRYELNEYDLYAVEEAIRLAETRDARVTLVTIGSEEAVQGLRKGLAMGADDAVHIHAEADLADPAASAAALAAALRPREPDLVLTGVESDDLGGSQVGVLIAEQLGYSCVTMTIAAELPDAPGPIRARRELESGNYVEVEARLPAVLTIQTGINEPRYPSLRGIMAAKRKEITRLRLEDLEIQAGKEPLVETIELQYPPPRERARMIEGAPEQAAVELLRLLREEEKVL